MWCLLKVVRCFGCDEPYAVLQPLTSCSATLTFLHCEPSSVNNDERGTQQLQSLSCHSNTDNNGSGKTLEFIASVLHKMPVLACSQGMYLYYVVVPF